MSDRTPRTISLSLISHTNVGKTTLARTLLGREVGEVRDEAHVTDSADAHVLIETDAGDRLLLWDTPGFGDSARLARRLQASGDPIGWFLSTVWDRFRDRALWSSQQAVRNVREQADIVLYLVNASEEPELAGYVVHEMQVLDWIGRPVIVLLNQLGEPRPADEEAAEVERWRQHLAISPNVRVVLPLDAFARCWVQEATLLRVLAQWVPQEAQPAFDRLFDAWFAQRNGVFEAAIALLIERLARAAADRETLPPDSLIGRLQPSRPSTRRAAMRALADRLDADIRAGTDRLITLHELSGQAGAEVLARLAEHYVVHEPLSERKAALVGGTVSGALAGFKADLATGGLSFGAGLLAGGVIGALGAFGLARGYNVVRGATSSWIAWSDTMLDELVVTALLGYLAVAHYGRGRGDYTASEHPPHWRQVVETCIAERRNDYLHAWTLRGEPDARAGITEALGPVMLATARAALERLYPDSASRQQLQAEER
ncbi:MAG: DUF3482 domain-containing protein [Burkholderiaceae bacterium]